MAKVSTRREKKVEMARMKKRMAKLRAVRLRYVMSALDSRDAFVTGLLHFEIEAAMDQYKMQRYRQFALGKRRASRT